MISEQERAFELEADEYRATEVRTMETVIKITRETEGESRDIEVVVDVDVDSYGVVAALGGFDREGNRYVLTEKERDRAADQAWEEYHE
jgi:hypothetical protein